ncbi:MAG TPA: hypothetical protein VFB12_20515 [Ktedonobacteraceae bacterium]|nr:hypothetical protein [Ktedonobacteraceae bacterium]
MTTHKHAKIPKGGTATLSRPLESPPETSLSGLAPPIWRQGVRALPLIPTGNPQRGHGDALASTFGQPVGEAALICM